MGWEVVNRARQCARYQHVLTRHEQRSGCSRHLFIPDLIAAEQIEAGEDWVSYRLPDGTVWRDGMSAEADETRIVTHGACYRCGGDRYAARPGNGPHAFGLTCLGCGHRGRWLGRTDAVKQGIAA